MLSFLGSYKWIAIAAGVIILAGGVLFAVNHIYTKGETAGASKVVDKLQKDTIEQQEKARVLKEQVDEEIRTTPFIDKLDKLR